MKESKPVLVELDLDQDLLEKVGTIAKSAYVTKAEVIQVLLSTHAHNEGWFDKKGKKSGSRRKAK